MDYRTLKDDETEEEISDSFLCCVCLELLYKPIVLSCGHLSCFWCVHKSMNGLRESHCPICRDPYLHFPSVCQKLHFLLKKLYPLAYRKREEQILKEEWEQGCFSPQIDAVLNEPKTAAESGCNGTSVNISGGGQKEEECPSDVKTLTSSPDKGDSPCITNNGESKAAETADEDDLSRTKKDRKEISKDDLLCSACMKLLVRPVVLNCGHVYCKACIMNPIEENEKIRCQECQALDPRGFPKVCLVLEHFLKEIAPEEYTSRSNDTERKQIQNNTRSSQTSHKGGPSLPSTNDLLWWANPGSNVHIGAGCDSCGIYPIVGDRYRCKDCKEEIGYDLCSECYNTRSKLPGRFNQQHTPDHRLERVDVPQLRFVTRLLEDGTNSIVFLPESPTGDGGNISGPGSDDDEDRAAPNQNEDEESSDRTYPRSSSI
ncbi:PREDICTED: E3 ubiquitin-protein ligase PRT1-like [Tarenaya hassleriana]|uniref:E3 ubiquitin-protein ligase PRT1-like n=1 Tax=Tarenaya hassleriana TaxID=28532 RepID=UPI00053C4EF5|nr:PREDICTED: E3 ubiquitin-protein ligase PRT1-like [Tarenaya hassleriana]XP_010532889.1 PREDICTED: E3 ubiquitin-protein ligase PRT1-like [Tarenaya hassleriana]